MEEATQLLRRRDQLASFAHQDECDDATADVDLEIEGADSGHTIRRRRPMWSSWRGRRSTARRCSAGWTTRGWLSRGRGCAVLTGDGAAREIDVPLDSARRWRVVDHSLHLERETPVQKWPLQCSRIARDPAAPVQTSWYASPVTSPTLKSPKPPPITNTSAAWIVPKARRAARVKRAPCSMIMRFATSRRSPPAFGWESPDAQGRTAADRKMIGGRRNSKAKVGRKLYGREKPAQAPLLGGFLRRVSCCRRTAAAL